MGKSHEWQPTGGQWGEWSALGWVGCLKVQVTELGSGGCCPEQAGIFQGLVNASTTCPLPTPFSSTMNHYPKERGRLRHIAPGSYVRSHPSDLRWQLLHVPGQRVQEGGGQVGSICSQRQHTAGRSPHRATRPSQVQVHRRSRPPGPRSCPTPSPQAQQGATQGHTQEKHLPADTYPLDREAAREGKRRALKCPVVPQVSNNSSMAAAPTTAAGLCPTQAPSDCQGWEEQVPPACP